MTDRLPSPPPGRDAPQRRSRGSFPVPLGWVLGALVTLGCVAVGVTATQHAVTGLRTDASVVGTFADPGDRCPDRVEYDVDGVTYDVDTQRWCSRDSGMSTSPQRVFYDSDDPEVAILADPVGTTPTVVLDFVVVALVTGLAVWLLWLGRRRLRR